MLTVAALRYPEINASIESVIQQKREEDSKRVITFDKVPNQIWRLATTTTRMDRYDQEVKAMKVVPKIVEKIESIADQCGENSSPETRLNALSTLRRIGELICRCSTDYLGRYIQQDFLYDGVLEDSMMRILRAMTPEERKQIRDGESQWSKLVALDPQRLDRMVFKNYHQVLDFLSGKEVVDLLELKREELRPGMEDIWEWLKPMESK
jgi:hypothetical protein